MTGFGFPHQVAWIGDSTIAYLAIPSGGQTEKELKLALRFVNPISGSERVFPLPDEAGLPFGVVGSPDGSQLLVNVAKGSLSSGWLVVSLLDSSVTPIPALESWSAWTVGGRIFGSRQRPDSTEVWSLPAAGGGLVRYARLPVACENTAFPSDASFLVCQQMVIESDIWMVEHFDPDVP